MDKVYISKKQAKLTLRRSGFSVEAAGKEVEKMAKTTVGKRDKVKTADVNRLIEEAARPTPISTLTIRPVIPRHLRSAKRIGEQ